jgi:hypothetical protein
MKIEEASSTEMSVCYPRDWNIQRHRCQNLQPRTSYIFCALGGIGVTFSLHTVPKRAAVNKHTHTHTHTQACLCNHWKPLQHIQFDSSGHVTTHRVYLVRTATLAYYHVTFRNTQRINP